MFFLAAIFVLACTDDSGVNPKREDGASTIGWRSAGFTPVISTQRGGGLQKVTHSGKWLVLMDAWTSPVEGKNETSTYSPRLFISKIGSGIWDTLVPPTSAYVKCLYADSAGVYVGTYKSGEVLVYSPEKGKWKNLSLMKKEESGWYYVYGIGRFGKNLVVSLAAYEDSLNIKEVSARILLQTDTGWTELPTPPMRYDIYNESKNVPLQFIASTELNGDLYVGTADGVWRLDGAFLSWSELPKFPKMKWNEKQNDVYEVVDLVAYKGSLVAIDGTNDRVYRWDGSDAWTELDSMILPSYVTAYGDTSYSIYRSSLHDIRELATDGKHLFISGQWHCPKVYMGDYGFPYGNISKGWRSIMRGWCNDKGCVSKNATYSLDIVGDTLYAAAWEGLFKIQLNDLDSAIAGQSDFNGFEKYQ